MEEAVRDKGKGFSEELSRALEKVGGGASVSTMTVCVQLAHCVDLDAFCEGFADERVKCFLKQVMGSEDAMVIKTSKNFSNSVVVKIPDKKKKGLSKAIKVFCNGSLHITGYNNIEEVLEMGEVMGTMFELIDGGNGLDEVYKVIGFDVQLINACYRVDIPNGKVIALERLSKRLQEETQWKCSYNNDQYSGVILRAVDFKLLLFDSGNIIVTSVVTGTGVEAACTFVRGFFSRNLYDLLVDGVAGVANKKGLKRKGGTAGSVGFDYGQFLVLK